MRVKNTCLTVVALVLALILISGCVDQESVLDSVTQTSGPDSTSANGLELERLWRRAEPISDEILDIWTEAVNKLGPTENRSCTYTKVTAPCEDCGDKLTRRSFYALRHSLLQPGMKALMEWFDTPATHTVSARIEEKFDSTLEPPWTLLTLDNEKPTENERYSHYQEKIALYSSVEQKRARREGRIPVGDFHPAAMRSWFEPLVLTHYLGTEKELLFVGVKPSRKSKSLLNKHLQLTVVIDSKTNKLKMFDQRALRGFVPHFGLRVNELSFQGTFEHEPTLDVVVLNHFEYAFRVRLTTFFPSKNTFTHWFRDFSCEDKSEVSDLGEHTS